MAPGGQKFEFMISRERPVIIGRGSAASVRIDDPGLSRRHCQISLTPQGLLLQDMGSSNGTFVNGQRVMHGFLRPGDEVSLGQTSMKPFPANQAPPLNDMSSSMGAAMTPPPTMSPAGMRPSMGAPGMHPGMGAPGMGAPGMHPGMGAPGMGAPGMHPGMGAPGMGAGMGAPGMHPGMGAPGMGAGMGAPGMHPGMGAPGMHPGMGAPGMPPGMGRPGMPPQNVMASRGMAPYQAPGGMAPPMPNPAAMDPSMIQCSRCGRYFKGTRAQLHWKNRNGDPGLLICESCKDLERMANDQVHGYELTEVLGKGAMGIVYKARSQNGEIVALKIVSLEGDPQGFQNFLREAMTGSKISHPNSVKTIEMGESSGKFYLVMEFVKGKTLEDLVKERGCLDQHYIINMTYVLLDVLEAARKVGLIHRDLKPANILVQLDGSPKVTDFGLAKLISDAGKSGLTAPGDLRGTPMYMPPEQLENAAMVDHRADLYALAATMYNALTNKFPFNVKTLRDLCMALEHEEPTPVHEHNPAVSPILGRFIQKLMAKKPEDRFQTAAEAQQELVQVRNQLAAKQ